jgi:hypothetical protein
LIPNDWPGPLPDTVPWPDAAIEQVIAAAQHGGFETGLHVPPPHAGEAPGVYHVEVSRP